MGCGASNTLETSEFRKNEQNKKTSFLKVMENHKSISSAVNDLVQYRNRFSTNEESITKIVEEYKSSAKDNKFKDEELKDIISYALAKTSGIKCQKKVGKGTSFLLEVTKIYNDDKQKIAEKVFKENTGEEYDIIFVELEHQSFLKHVVRTINFDPEYASYNSMMFLIDESAVDCLESMTELAFLIKSHPLKNLVIGLGNTVKANSLDNVSLLFEGVALSKTLKNFTFVRLYDQTFTLKPETSLKIINATAHAKIQSLGIVNFTLGDQERSKFLHAISTNSNISLVGIQDIGATPKDVEVISTALSKSKTLRCLLIGVRTNDCDEVEKKNIDLFKGNSKFEGLVLGLLKS